jgi:hypothetical protein
MTASEQEVIRKRAEHPRAVACTVCEGIEFRIERGESDTIERLRCGRVEPFKVVETVKELTDQERQKANNRIESAISSLDDALDDLRQAQEELE